MTPADFNALPGGPPLPEEIDPTDPIGVERWLMEAAAHVYRVVCSKTPIQSRAVPSSTPTSPNRSGSAGK